MQYNSINKKFNWKLEIYKKNALNCDLREKEEKIVYNENNNLKICLDTTLTIQTNIYNSW